MTLEDPYSKKNKFIISLQASKLIFYLGFTLGRETMKFFLAIMG
jgi:hypothetical protein